MNSLYRLQSCRCVEPRYFFGVTCPAFWIISIWLPAGSMAMPILMPVLPKVNGSRAISGPVADAGGLLRRIAVSNPGRLRCGGSAMVAGPELHGHRSLHQ